MSAFNAKDFLPKPHQHSHSSNASIRSHTSRLSLRSGSKLGLKRNLDDFSKTQALIEPSGPPQPTPSTSAKFVAPKKPGSAVATGGVVENEISPLARVQSSLFTPTKQQPTYVEKSTQRTPRITFNIEDEDDQAMFTPTPKKAKSPAKRSGPSPAKSTRSSLLTEFDSSKGFCPLCQVPLACIKITRFAHTERCQVAEDSPECPDGESCVRTSWAHFRDIRHTLLAEARAMEVSSLVIDVEEDEPRPNASPLPLRLEAIIEFSSEHSTPSKVDNNPFLSSDDGEEEDENIMNGCEREEEEKVEEINIESDKENKTAAAEKLAEFAVGDVAGEFAPCLSGTCDKNKPSVTVTVGNEAVKFLAMPSLGWDKLETTKDHQTINHVLCRCKNNLLININPPVSEQSQAAGTSAKDQWSKFFAQRSSSNHANDSSASSSSTASSLSRPVKCPDHKLIKNTRFAVDAFNYGSIPNVKFFFLTHFHYDHYIGLTKHFSGTIYCSSLTAKLVKMQFKLRDNQLRCLPLEEMISVDGVKVTAFDANHCPGSVMLLFELLDGTRTLHTGDFRFSPVMESYSAFWNSAQIANLHLDTTYCDPKYDFPPQDEIISLIGILAEENYMADHNCLFVCGSYTIGKEKVYLEIAKRLDLKFWAEASKRKILALMEDTLVNKYIVDKQESASIHVLANGKINFKHLTAYAKQLKKSVPRIVAFKPSGWQHKSHRERPYLCEKLGNLTIYSIPYSEHSSFSELRRFVKFLKPLKVKPTVRSRDRSWGDMYTTCNNWLNSD